MRAEKRINRWNKKQTKYNKLIKDIDPHTLGIHC